MFTRFDDFDRTFAVMDQLRRRMDRLFDEVDPGRGPRRDALRASLADEAEWLSPRGRFPRMTFAEDGESLVVKADVPGLSEQDVQLSIHQDVLTMSGERKPDAPQGHVVHRQERATVKFARSFSLPCKVDPERSTASVKDGVLTITLAKAAEAQPKQIAVKAH
jgi:HSP20 family protein